MAEANIDRLKTILHHLLRQSPVSEPEQKKLHEEVENLHLSDEEVEQKKDEEEPAPPGFEQVPDAPPGTFRRIRETPAGV
jgi:hypothetical protein